MTAAVPEPAEAMAAPLDSIVAIAFSGSGKLLAAARENAVEIIDADAGRRLRVFSGHTGSVRDIALAHDATVLASATDHHTVRILEVATGAVRGVLAHPEDMYPSTLVFSPDGRWLAVAPLVGPVRVWDLAGGSRRVLAAQDSLCADTMAFSPDGATLAVGHDSGDLWIYDLTSWTPRTILMNPRRTAMARVRNLCIRRQYRPGVVAAGFSPDGALLTTVTRDGTARIWDLATGAARSSRQTDEAAYHTTGAAVFADGTQVVTFTDAVRHAVHVWDLTSGTRLRRTMGAPSLVTAVAVSPDGCRLAVGGSEGMLQVWTDATSDPYVLNG